MPNPKYKLSVSDSKPSSLVMVVNQTEWIKISEDGFWVRGQKVEQDAEEAKTVYNAFKEFLTWSALTRNY